MVQTQDNSEVGAENVTPSVDNPLSHPQADRLGFASFARYLANSIDQMVFAESFVIAVYGPWGSGKSTLLNFVVHYLQQKPEDEQPIIVPFNPWLFSGQEDIARRFFDQLQSVLHQRRFVPKGLKDRIADLAKVISETPLPYAQTGNAVARLFDDKQKDTSDLKEEVEDTLQQKHARVVVTIDDIDRLPADDMKKLFRLIKAFPDFTNVVYFLVLDKEVAIGALAETPDGNGEAQLDKIVQVPFELPLPDKTLLRRLLFEQLDTIVTDKSKQLFDQTYWSNVYFQGIDHFITNPRDLIRLTNTLSVKYPAVKGEVNSVDFIAIESLRVFCPSIYNVVRRNPKVFTWQAGTQKPLDSTNVNLLNSWLVKVRDEDREPVKRLLLYLFPKLETVWGASDRVQQESTWRSQGRICSSEVFPIYFRLTLSEGDFSSNEMNAILASAEDEDQFGEDLIELANQKRPDGTTQLRTFLERLENYTEREIPLDCIPSIVRAFFAVGDRLLPPEDEPHGIFDFGNDVRIGRIIEQLLRRQEQATRFELLREAMSNGKALSIIVREAITLCQEQGKYEAPGLAQELLSSTQQKKLEKIALKRVQDAAQQNSLIQTPGLPQVLNFWRERTGDDEVQQWVHKAIDNDEELVNFLEKFFEETSIQPDSDAVLKKGYSLDLNLLEPYIEPSSLIDRVKSLTEKGELTEQQITVTKRLVEAYELRQQEEADDQKN